MLVYAGVIMETDQYLRHIKHLLGQRSTARNDKTFSKLTHNCHYIPRFCVLTLLSTSLRRLAAIIFLLVIHDTTSLYTQTTFYQAATWDRTSLGGQVRKTS